MQSGWKARGRRLPLVLLKVLLMMLLPAVASARSERGAEAVKEGAKRAAALEPRRSQEATPSPTPTPRPQPTPPSNPIHVISPRTEPPAQAGRFNAPRKITIEISNFVNGFLNDELVGGDFEVMIGGEAAQVFFAIMLYDRYVLIVEPPDKPAPGFFDLEVSALGSSALVLNAVQYTVEDRVHADVALTIDRSGSMGFDNYIEGAIEASSLFVDQMVAGDNAAVVGFDHASEVVLPLTPVRDAGTTVYSTDLESGTAGWQSQAPWAIETRTVDGMMTQGWSDSPGGPTGDNVSKAILMPTLDLTGAQSPFLQFDHFLDLEDGFDYGQVLISTNGGMSFQALKRYSGSPPGKQRALIDLTPYAGLSPVFIAFQVVTDYFTAPGESYDGWFIDNIAIGETETRSAVKAAIRSLYPRGATSIGGGLLQAQAQLDGFAHSGVAYWTDSPDDLYYNGLEQSLVSPSINISGVPNPQLRFWSRYEFEFDFDFGKVFASTNNGSTWTELVSLTGASDWAETVVDLRNFVGATNLKFDFRVVTDNSLRADGWYIDDVLVRSGSNPAIVAFSDNMEISNGNWAPDAPWARTTGRASPDHAWSIILLSDGFENSPPFVENVLPRIVNSRTRVFTIALGPDADQALLQQIASATGGSYYLAPGADDLAPIYAEIAGEVSRVQKLIEKSGAIAQSEIVEEIVLIDADANPATFTISWAGPENQLDLTLETPSGGTIDPLSAEAYYTETATSQSYIVTDPETGVWTLKTTGTTVVPTPSVAFTSVVTATTNVEIYAYLDRQNDVYFSDEIVWIMVGAADSEALLGANVTAEITGPGMFSETLTLLDDGQHRDGIAGDGLYGIDFHQTAGVGGYKVTILVEGMATAGGSFQRSALNSTVLLEPPPAGTLGWNRYR